MYGGVLRSREHTQDSCGLYALGADATNSPTQHRRIHEGVIHSCARRPAASVKIFSSTFSSVPGISDG